MTDLHLVRLQIDLPAAMRAAELTAPPHADIDDGYLAHATLAKALGDAAPQPFALTGGRGRYLEVLAYTPHAGEELRALAEAVAQPHAYQAVRWTTLATKPMPRLEAGRRLGFEVRVCPVVRLGAPLAGHRKGAEIDAFLAAAFKAGPETKLAREAVYADWLTRQFERSGGAKATGLALQALRRTRLTRRTQGDTRKPVAVDRPDVVLRGQLEVTDPDAFRALLARGVGRHRAFGFGMVLLRPPEA